MRAVGVDVGGPRKGLDVAVLDGLRLVGHARGCRAEDVLALAREHQAQIVAIDSPRSCAPPGELSRESERRVARDPGLCAIRYTPDADTVRDGGDYYAWVRVGLGLFALLAREEPALRVIEVFPTASWTVWHGPRGGRSRGAWSARALAEMRVAGVPPRPSQDLRDAIGAALTGLADLQGRARSVGPDGELVVPTARPLPA